ncbi:hypothetical protein HWD31_gp39 [Pantoea phage vB_PagM_SSEM1]|uniref:Gp34 n=2 Tax=Loessnervirus TaxID=2732962 RepID=G0YPY3_9CAUD|nr:gp34 [Erwinia phage vB_EamM-Y2]YP_009859352.1 hypothetical protein HWD31_gp39 [Pantoea phage vB_PagM_SSEM1]WJN63841.1 hypothetical protein Erwinia_phage_Calisson_00038 [Erwinia phage Calisson]WJN63891.1 hypothetical protein Erwinia_phage_Farigoule_00004 [Erwinia phage Farigoule]WJN64014.1 hypothetical protein Erwinia_phage_Fougasse_00051 [Erwinia phage Fougasse]WJN64247.1 hypothetical protein Erwinia_phage_Nougat_00051 [Erwinia phage Nougat]WJN64279.1 hypothetical protein Erwinia_phage_Org
MSKSNEQDRIIALETIKMWLQEHDAVYLAKENVITYWEHFSPDSKKGEWVKLKPYECCRIIKATRAGFDAMKLIKPELIMMAAQETERAFKQGIFSRSNAPSEYFNFCRSQHFNRLELLTLCMLQELVGRGWNVEAVCLGKLMVEVFYKHGFVVPNRTLRWKLLRAVAEEAGVLIRDRLDRLTVYGVGRFVCVQIEGITDSIKTELTEDEINSLIREITLRFAQI